MPLSPELRRRVDDLRNYLHGSGNNDPMANAEQLSFLFFFYMMEAVNRARAPGTEDIFAGEWELRNPNNARESGQNTVPKTRLRWSEWKDETGERLLAWVRDEVFPFYTEVAARSPTNFLEGARLNINEPMTLQRVIGKIDDFDMVRLNSDTKGDLFEYVLSTIRESGKLGQFRTPRHIIRAIVRMVNPRLRETIYDPAVGTAGFLVAAYDHIRLTCSSEYATEEVEVDGKRVMRGSGDQISDADRRLLQTKTFYGNDVNPPMVRLAAMNLFLRELRETRILRRCSLTVRTGREERTQLGLPPEGYDVILANPPFSGLAEFDRLTEDVKVGDSKQTEILFLKHMLNSLKAGGRAGVVVPGGVLFKTSYGPKEIRRQLLNDNTLEAVMSLPAGVFKPYSGVKTSVLFFRKGGKTERVLFLHADNDGYKLDAQHSNPIEADDLPALVEAYRTRKERAKEWANRDPSAEWPHKWWFASAEEISAKCNSLEAHRYKPESFVREEHQAPSVLMDELLAIHSEINETGQQLARTLLDWQK